jgi:hypothetical protein
LTDRDNNQGSVCRQGTLASLWTDDKGVCSYI